MKVHVKFIHVNKDIQKIVDTLKKNGRCKFSPCAFKHEVFMNHNERLEKDIKDLNDKIHALEEIIMNKEKTINEITANLLEIERK